MTTCSKLIFIEFFKIPIKGGAEVCPFLRKLINLAGILLNLLGAKHA
jgi:hypothetical protein